MNNESSQVIKRYIYTIANHENGLAGVVFDVGDHYLVELWDIDAQEIFTRRYTASPEEARGIAVGWAHGVSLDVYDHA